jgi:aldehyde:ferredoxin oxidoreductase
MNTADVHYVINFQKERFYGSSEVNEERIHKLCVRNWACFGCLIYCGKLAEVKSGRYKTSLTEGSEYENV